MEHCPYNTDCSGCVSFGDTLLDVNKVSLSYGNKVILRDVNVQVQKVKRRCHIQGQVVGFLGPSGIGKCLAKDTPVLMFDGCIKPVQDIIVGELLMGPDSKPRRVLALGRGEDEMYDVIPTKGDSFRANGPHILPLILNRGYKEGKEPYREIRVDDFNNQSKTFRGRAKMLRIGVEFPPKATSLDPYFLGLWLGDGDSNQATITSADKVIVDWLYEYAAIQGFEITKFKETPEREETECPRYNLHANWNRSLAPSIKLRKLGVLDNKHIPLLYRANTREIRLLVLAGLLDSDGYLSSNCFVFTNKNHQLALDTVYIARSLGLAAYIKEYRSCSQTGVEGTYYDVTISGHVDKIPTKLLRRKAKPRKQIKDVLRNAITVKPAGIEQYFGFQLDGDGLFLLGDFTITHNTQLFRIMAGLNKPTSGGVYINSKHELVHPGMVGVVAQSYTLFEHRTILENLKLGAEKKYKNEKEAEEKIDFYLNLFELTDKKELYPAHLSGGQRQRIAIVQQLLSSDHFILMDEPFSGLDLVMLEKVCKLIVDVSCLDELNTIIVVTHDIVAAASVADHLWLMGRDKNEDGSLIPGARIQENFNLVDLGLCWQDKITTRPDFVDFVRTVKDRFRTL